MNKSVPAQYVLKTMVKVIVEFIIVEFINFKNTTISFLSRIQTFHGSYEQFEHFFFLFFPFFFNFRRGH